MRRPMIAARWSCSAARRAAPDAVAAQPFCADGRFAALAERPGARHRRVCCPSSPIWRRSPPPRAPAAASPRQRRHRGAHRRRRSAALRPRPRPRPRRDRSGRRGQPAPAAPRRAEPVAGVEPGAALPQRPYATSPPSTAFRRGDAAGRGPAAGDGAGRAAVRRLAPRAGPAARRRRAAAGRRHRHRLARAGRGAEVRVAVGRARRAHRAEIQFGHVSRPTHENTSWDAARFEVVGAPLDPRRRARLGHGADHRLHLRLRCFASDPRRKGEAPRPYG